MSHSELYLLFPNKASVAVQVTLTDDGLLVQGIGRPDICFWIGGLTALQAVLSPTVKSQAHDICHLSPVDVVRYFAQSPVLRIYLEDAKIALLGNAKATQKYLQLEEDLQATEHLQSPSQADIAEALYGDRNQTGGSFRRRILAVLDARSTKTTTTTQVQVVATPKKRRKAA